MAQTCSQIGKPDPSPSSKLSSVTSNGSGGDKDSKSGPLKLRLNAPSRWLGHLKTGLAFEVAIEETGKRYPAKVSAVNSRVDSVSQTVELEATLSGNFPELLPGMSGTAVFPAR